MGNLASIIYLEIQANEKHLAILIMINYFFENLRSGLKDILDYARLRTTRTNTHAQYVQVTNTFRDFFTLVAIYSDSPNCQN